MRGLYRSRRDRWVTGLIGGIAEYFNVNSAILRILMLISIPITGGTTIFIYFIASLVISKEPYAPHDPYHPGGWNQGGYQYGPRPEGPQGYHDPRYQHDPRHGQHPPMGNQAFGNQTRSAGHNFETSGSSNLDQMMQDIEKKAMKKELEQLRQKLSNYEKGEK